MAFPFALSRIILLTLILIMNTISIVLSAIALHEKSSPGCFQVVVVSFGVLNALAIISFLCYQSANPDEETSNVRNLGLFGFCGLLDLALAVSLTVHARQDGGMGLCSDFAKVTVPCIPAGVLLGMAYASPILAIIGIVISWIDKFPGAVKVTPRYPITKAPSSHFAAHAHELDGDRKYTPAPVRKSSRQRNDSEWSDVPIC